VFYFPGCFTAILLRMRRAEQPELSQGVDRTYLHGGEQVAVSVQRDVDFRVPQSLGHDLGVGVLQKQQRGGRVPQVVEADVRQTARLQEGPPVAGREVRLPKVSALAVREDQGRGGGAGGGPGAFSRSAVSGQIGTRRRPPAVFGDLMASRPGSSGKSAYGWLPA